MFVRPSQCYDLLTQFAILIIGVCHIQHGFNRNTSNTFCYIDYKNMSYACTAWPHNILNNSYACVINTYDLPSPASPIILP